MSSTSKIFAVLTALTALIATANADPIVTPPIVTAMTDLGGGKISYDGSERDAWLKSATSGFAIGDVTGTPGKADVTTYFGDTWVEEGALTANGKNDWLTVSATPSWGTGPIAGTWEIDAQFWQTHGSAVITMHVGNGSGNPDWFLWKITPNATSGTFYYNVQSGGGGGLSNLFLFGSGTPQVPDSGTTVILLGAALVGLGLARRRIA